jgi:8-oxo-dGTP pyrophosphatase MutT (NUDIX family)
VVEIEQREDVSRHEWSGNTMRVVNGDILPVILSRLRAASSPPARADVAFRVDAVTIGRLAPHRIEPLKRFADVFVMDGQTLRFGARCADEPARTTAMARVARELARDGLLTAWRDERYAVAAEFGATPLFMLERAAARYFGVHTYAAHVNAFVRDRDGALRLWFARRSPTKAIDPGQLDNLVAGGIAADIDPAIDADPIRATLVKEAWEEAGIPEGIARRASPAGTVEIAREQRDGLQRETIFVHDLELPAGFVPCNQDGEAVDHRLVALDEAARLVANASGPDVVTADASLVVLGFLLRHGAIASEAPERRDLEALLALAPALSRAASERDR